MNDQHKLEIGDTLVKLTGDADNPTIDSVWHVLDVHAIGDTGRLVSLTEVTNTTLTDDPDEVH